MVKVRVVLATLGFAIVGCSQEAPTTTAVPPTTAKPPATTKPPTTATPAANPSGYVGSDVCGACHAAEHAAWRKSHHFAAMQPPSPDSVLGDFRDAAVKLSGVRHQFTREGDRFLITADGPTGALTAYQVRYTFGAHPLQQYLLALPGGRLQASAVAWDNRAADAGGQRWFHLQPDAAGDPADVLHWTGGAFNWNAICADCHSTAVRKNYDATKGTYETVFEEANVGCEACHGPGAGHAGEPAGERLRDLSGADRQINACAPCHSRRSQLAEGFTPAAEFLDHYQPALLDEGLYHADGQIQDEVFVYGSFLQSKMYQRGVTCSDCHDVHAANVVPDGDDVCTQCHSQAGAPRFPTLRRASYDNAGHHFHPVESGIRCVACHMPERTYMAVDPRRDHGFRIPRPDLTVTAGVPNPCNTCHADQTPQWAADRVAAHVGPRRDDHFAGTLLRARALDPGVETTLADLGSDAARAGIVRATALALMAGYNRGSSATAVSLGLRADDPLVRIGAVRGAARWPPLQRWDKARHLLDDPLLAVRYEAARLLLDAYPRLPASERGVFAAKLDNYRQTLMLQADRAEAQTSIATLDVALDDWAAAERALQAALDLNPSWVPAMVNLADLYRATGRDSLGGVLLDKALTLDRRSAEVTLAKALWLVRQNRASQAMTLFERAWQLAPNVGRYAYVYAVALHSEGRSSDALDVLDEQLTRTPDDAQLLEAAASVARDAGQPARSERYVRQLR